MCRVWFLPKHESSRFGKEDREEAEERKGKESRSKELVTRG
jgi:hypothetical protein